MKIVLEPLYFKSRADPKSQIRQNMDLTDVSKGYAFGFGIDGFRDRV